MIEGQARKENVLLSAYEKGSGRTVNDRPHGGSSPEKLGAVANNEPKNSNKQKIYEFYSTVNQDDDEDGHLQILKVIEGENNLDGHQIDDHDVHFFDIAKRYILEDKDKHMEATLGQESDETSHTKPRFVGQPKDDHDDQIDCDTFIVNPSDQYNDSSKVKHSPNKLTKTDHLSENQGELPPSAITKKKNVKKGENPNLKDELGDLLFAKAENQDIEPGKTQTEAFDEDAGEIKGLIDLKRDSSNDHPEDFQTEHGFGEIYEVHDEQKNHITISTKDKIHTTHELIDETAQIKAENLKWMINDPKKEKNANVFTNSKATKDDKINDAKDISSSMLPQHFSQTEAEKKLHQSNKVTHKSEKKATPSEGKKVDGHSFKNESIEVETQNHEVHIYHLEEEKIEIIYGIQSSHQYPSDYADKASLNSLHEKHERDHTDLEGKALEVLHDDDIVEISRKSQVKIKDRKSIEDKRLIINFASAWSVVKNLNLSAQRKLVAVQTDKAGGLFGKLFGSCSATKLPGSLASERDQILAYSKVPFQEDNELHFDILRSIFIKLTGNYNCPRYGSHWEIIGFQGKDPAMDLRGAGMLGLIQILAFVTSHFETLKEALAFSLKDKLNPPLCSSMLGVTLIVMELVREGRLNGQINSQRSAINAINNIYFAIYFKIYSTFKNEKMKIEQYQTLLRDVTEATKRSPHRVLTEFLHGLESNRAYTSHR